MPGLWHFSGSSGFVKAPGPFGHPCVARKDFSGGAMDSDGGHRLFFLQNRNDFCYATLGSKLKPDLNIILGCIFGPAEIIIPG